MKRSEREIGVQERFLADHGAEDASHAERAAALRKAKKGRAEILIDEVRKRLERNPPTDLQLRFELGEHLVNAEVHREALPDCSVPGKSQRATEGHELVRQMLRGGEHARPRREAT